MKKIVVIGAGPAGMMAAATAAKAGASVSLLEKKERPGRKLAITGKGRCNITSALDQDELIKNYPGNGRFLYSALSQFSNRDLIQFLNEKGLKTKVERGQRVFPESDKASDVVDLLYNNARKNGVEFHFSNPVEAVNISENRVISVTGKSAKIAADAVIIASGGLSYPGTGSTGDGYRWAMDAGHNIVEPRAGLVPLETEESWNKDLQGLSLRNVQATAFTAEGKKINQEFGEMLFTHFGISGPIILSMSRDIGEYLYKNKKAAVVEIDLKPALSEEQLDQRLQRDLDKYSRKIFKNSLNDLLPHKLIPVIIKLSGIDEEKASNQINKEERHQLLKLLKHLRLTVRCTRPVAEAIVTAGGVDVKQINPKTMQSKLVEGLFFAGEVMDIDGYTGGFNLQAAFSTAYAAGRNAAL